MTKQRFLELLNRKDLAGVGAVAHYTDGSTAYTFYEDFENDKGIDRAARQFQVLIDNGYVSRVEYIHKEARKIHFFDWNTKPGSFCAADEMRKYCKAHGHEIYTQLFSFIAVIDGEKYRLDYTPAIDGISALIATYAN